MPKYKVQYVLSAGAITVEANSEDEATDIVENMNVEEVQSNTERRIVVNDVEEVEE
jgi:hypothetical protein